MTKLRGVLPLRVAIGMMESAGLSIPIAAIYGSAAVSFVIPTGA
jgi:hypothetical protein